MFEARANASVEKPSDQSARVKTSQQPHAYGAILPLTDLPAQGELLLRIRAEVEQGPVGLGVLTKDASNFIDRTSVVDPRSVEVFLKVPDSANVSSLVLQTWDRGGPAKVTIKERTTMVPGTR